MYGGRAGLVYEVGRSVLLLLAIPGAMIFDPHVWLLVNRHEQVSSLLE